MNLLEQDFLILDCQTTGMRPSVGQLLEISWAWARASDSSDTLKIETRQVALAEGKTIPARVREITGITENDLIDAIPLEQVRDELLETLNRPSLQASPQESLDSALPAVLIHYAQFEQPFLLDLLRPVLSDDRLPFDIICTHKLSKRLHPQVPSRNIRGLSGFFGVHFDEIKRAPQHVRATFEIWRGLAVELDRLGLKAASELGPWLDTAPKAKAARYEYRVDKNKRLNLPDRPGVYRMYSKTGKILYVGKATSLKERVNSYFRGKRGRDPRKLELMAQVWDLDFIECGSPLEAALLETDEIKRYDPPYNVSLKTGRRGLVFYSRDFESLNESQNSSHPLGPFRPFNSIERLRLLARSLEEGVFQQVFYDPVPPEDLAAGFDLFCLQNNVDLHAFTCLRDHLALGLRFLRTQLTLDTIEATDTDVEEEEPNPNPDSENEETTTLTIEEIAEKFERLYLHAAREFYRSRLLTKLLNAKVSWNENNEWRTLTLNGGRISTGTSSSFGTVTGSVPVTGAGADFGNSEAVPWHGLAIADYDRMSVLLSELSKHEHTISPSF